MHKKRRHWIYTLLYTLLGIVILIGIIMIGFYFYIQYNFAGELMSGTEWYLAKQCKEMLQTHVEIPMIDFVYSYPGNNGVIFLYGTLRREEDILLAEQLTKHMPGVKKVISSIKVGDYQEMYSQKIADYLDHYERFKSWESGYKERAYKHLTEYLFYREHLPENIIQDAEKLQELLRQDIELSQAERTPNNAGTMELTSP